MGAGYALLRFRDSLVASPIVAKGNTRREVEPACNLGQVSSVGRIVEICHRAPTLTAKRSAADAG
jgi:hypothetical protein